MSSSKIAVVVGVGEGLGSSIAHRFASEDFDVALIARNEDKLTAIQSSIEKEKLGVKALSIAADVTETESIISAFDKIKSDLGAPNVLIYNAGIFKIKGILELTPEEFEYCWQVNCSGAFIAAQQVLPAMVEQKKGTILLTGATAGLRGSANFAALAVGKFGLRALSQSLAREFAPQGIHVAHVIIDGLINTKKVQEMAPNRQEHELLSPDAIAENYWNLHQQHPTTWTLELDLRPAVEKF